MTAFHLSVWREVRHHIRASPGSFLKSFSLSPGIFPSHLTFLKLDEPHGPFWVCHSNSQGEQILLLSMFDLPVTVAEAPLKGVASTGDVDCMCCHAGYKTNFKWVETVPLRHVKSNCRSAFETEKVWKTAADCPHLRLFRAVRVMELTRHNLAVSYTNRISYLWHVLCIEFTAYQWRNDSFVCGFVLRLPRCGCGALQSASPNILRHQLHSQSRALAKTQPSYSGINHQCDRESLQPKMQLQWKNIPQSFQCHQHNTIGVMKGFGERKQWQPKNCSNKL